MKIKDTLFSRLHKKYFYEKRDIPAKTRERLIQAAVIGCWTGFFLFLIMLASVLTHTGIAVFDHDVKEWVDAQRSPFLTPFMVVLAVVFGPIVMPILIASVTIIWIILSRHIWRPVVLAVAMGTGVVIVQTISHLVQRPRPPVDLMLLEPDHTFSFPSGHVLATSDFMLICAYLIISRKPTRARIIAASIIVPFVILSQIISRIYLGYHWLSDTLASVSLAILITSLVILIDTLFTSRNKKQNQKPLKVVKDIKDDAIKAITNPAVKAAESANQSTWFEFLARFGYIANGLVHGLFGLAVIAVSLGSPGELDQAGVLQPLSKLLLGKVFLSLLFVSFLSLGLWKVVQLIAINNSKVQRHPLRKIEEALKAIAYIVLGVSIGVYVLSPTPAVGSVTENVQLVSTILSHPFGAVGIALVALILIIVGGTFIFRGVTRRFLRSIDEPENTPLRKFITFAGSAGYIAKGLVFLSLGVVLFISLFAHDPSKAGGLDSAFHAFASLPFGTIILFLIGVGFVLYALYSIARARLAHLKFRKHKYL